MQRKLQFGICKALKEGCPGYATAWAQKGKRFDCLLTGRVFNLGTKARYNYRPTYQ